MHLFTLQDIDRLDLCEMLLHDYVFISCLHAYSDGTHLLQRIHCLSETCLLLGTNQPTSLFTVPQAATRVHGISLQHYCKEMMVKVTV